MITYVLLYCVLLKGPKTQSGTERTCLDSNPDLVFPNTLVAWCSLNVMVLILPACHSFLDWHQTGSPVSMLYKLELEGGVEATSGLKPLQG